VSREGGDEAGRVGAPAASAGHEEEQWADTTVATPVIYHPLGPGPSGNLTPTSAQVSADGSGWNESSSDQVWPHNCPWLQVAMWLLKAPQTPVQAGQRRPGHLSPRQGTSRRDPRSSHPLLLAPPQTTSI
jgi:hypothetical protein